MPEDQNHLPEPASSDPIADLQSLTRLVIGGTEMSVIELMRRLRQWELQVAGLLRSGDTGLPAAKTTGPDDQAQPGSAVSDEQARYALIGLVFELQERARKRLRLLGKLQRMFARSLEAVLQPIYHSRLAAPTRQQIDRLAERGQQEVSRWIERGRSEEHRSRMLAALAFDETVDAFLEYLTKNPEVRDLVQTQSTGLANEVLEEARERAVSADHFLEALARSLLRRVPRSRLPEPPPELRQRAAARRSEREKHS